ncbi:MAG TPA: Ni/Fe hydrogenase subunit alpha [Thermoanaerobaculia bacterium]|nr:Ni/Fe hydrogenase subunit alpha [Thermoanaerobaculia bacterium]
MSKNISINVHHLTRVEGHGNIIADVTNGTIDRIEWQVPEAPRFFEAMVRGRHYTEVARITSRICGICSVGHTLASVQATEAALGIEVSPQTQKLRDILIHAENFDSHILHLYFLVAPDLLGAPSVFPLVPTHGEAVIRALRMKKVGADWASLFAGRSTHPTRPVPGGFSEYPTMEELRKLRADLQGLNPDLEATVNIVLSVAGNLPAFERPTEYMALSNDEDYAFLRGFVQTVMPDGTKERWPVSEYRRITNEYVHPRSTAKYTKNKMDSYMAGALARFNNNYDQLHPKAKQIADAFGLKPVNCNPFMNNVAQLVEAAHSVFESIRLLDEILEEGLRIEELVQPTRFGQGASAVEVPRGILFHDYTYDDQGMCTAGNCIIPTNQNHANIQLDLEKFFPELLQAGKSEKELELAMEMLVRAYDPCISCSTHYLKVRFKD